MKHLFFDLDRTLWDFDTNSKAALEILFYEFELNQHIRSFRTFHTTYKKINAYLWELYGKGTLTKDRLRIQRFQETFRKLGHEDMELARVLADRYIQTSPYQTKIFPNTMEVLRELSAAGHPMHIITNGFREIQTIKLTNARLLDFFNVILCSEEVGKTKPSPEVFYHALKLADTSAENSIMIGDSYHADILGAENIGMKAILFDPHFQHENRSHKWKVNNFEQIPEMIAWMK